MNKIINKYLIFKFFRTFFISVLIFLSLGIMLNLFEELEFFKNLNLSFALPIILSLSYVPTLIMELLPFIIFLSSMFYFLHLKSSKDLLLIKVFGYSNLKILSIVSIFSFILGLLFLFAYCLYCRQKPIGIQTLSTVIGSRRLHNKHDISPLFP